MVIGMFAFSVLLASACLSLVSADTCAWETCPSYDERPGVLNVHLVPHSHDDLGWLKTVDQYYWGSRKGIVPMGVQYIYNTVIDELEKNSSRRFSFAETGFMWRWMVTHNVTDQQRFINLVKKGQIEIIGGGWVQPDEAAAHYMAVLDEHTLGLRYLNQWFGQCGSPVTGWQIDPFGHSREIANLHALMGYKSLYFAREHYLEQQKRLTDKALDMVWSTSDDLKTSLQTGVFHNGNYHAYPGFCWDIMCNDDPINDNPLLEEYNVQQIVDRFMANVQGQATHMRSSHMMFLFGQDFAYTQANGWFVNIDKLIKYVNGNSSLNVRLFYSTPSCYTQAVARLASPLPTKNTDFFPYASGQHSYWTGYFTSRPAHKLVVRRSNAFLQLARQLTVFANLSPSSDSSSLGLLDRASGLAQHHDSITGTAKEDVTRDYILQLSAGVQASANATLAPAVNALSANSIGSLVYCTLLNETRCDGIQDVSSLTTIAFNTLGRATTEIVRIPYWRNSALVKNANGTATTAQLVRTQTNGQWPANVMRAPYELLLRVSIPPAGFTSLSITSSASQHSASQHSASQNFATTTLSSHRYHNRADYSSTYIENEFLRVQLGVDGLVSTVTDKTTGTSHNLRQYAAYYEGATGTSTEQPSGAYIFRPKPDTPRFDIDGQVQSVQVVNGPWTNEIRQQLNGWVSQVVRLDAGANYVVFDWLIGPIPKEASNPITKEVVLRYETDVNGGDTFYTDANGRQTIKRRRAYSPDFVWQDLEPIAGNFYPITTRVHIADAQNAFGVVTDRSQSATAYNNTIEILVHRRCFYDDHYGVNEALDEPGTDGRGLVARGQHRVFFGSPLDVLERAQQESQRVFHSPELAFSTSTVSASFSGLKSDLPPEIHITTLDKLNGNDVLLRLEHIGESAANFGRSRPISVNIQDLFTKLRIVSATELALGADRPTTSQVSEFTRAERLNEQPLKLLDLTSIQLSPQQIRTFRLGVEYI